MRGKAGSRRGSGGGSGSSSGRGDRRRHWRLGRHRSEVEHLVARDVLAWPSGKRRKREREIEREVCADRKMPYGKRDRNEVEVEREREGEATPSVQRAS